MLILLEGGFTSVAHNELIKKITKSISDGKKTFLFVPEQQTLTAEAEACNIFPASAALNFEVTNFTRFTNTAFRTLGGIYGEYITPAKRSLIMWSVLTELSPLLTLTRGSSNINSGTVAKAMSAINEMQSLGIKPEEIATAEKSLSGSDARLKSKLSDLSLIYSLYKNKLTEKYNDAADDIIGLVSKLNEHPEYLENTNIYIEGFTSFTEPQYTLIRTMMRYCDVTVSLAIPKAGHDFFEYTEIRECEDRLLKSAAKDSTDRKLWRPDAKDPEFAPEISEIANLIWRTEGTLDEEIADNLAKKTDTVRIFEANTPFDECDFVAADIKKRVMSGARYSDFAIIARSIEKYAGILDTSLTKTNIPHFMSKRDNITSFEAIKLINTAYNTIIKNFNRSELMSYIKCGLCSASRDECDTFEIYISKWKIDKERFTDGELWNMNPGGYKEMREGDAEKLIKINEIKDKILTPLVKFRDSCNSAHTVKEQAEALLDFLIDIKLEKKLIERSHALRQRGESEAAEHNVRLWGIICDSLDTVVETVGDTPADAESFINQLSVIFADTGISSIPSFIDDVSVGQADMIRLLGKKHVYLLGVNRGEFPMTINDSSYFSERDKIALNKLGLAVNPDLEIKNAREYYSFSRSVCFAHQSVTLLYTKRTSSLSAAMPSEVIDRIKEITLGRITPISIPSLSIEDTIFSPEVALENLYTASSEQKNGIRDALLETDYKDILKISDGELENASINIPDSAMGLIVGKNIYLSQSKIDKFLRCPFKFFSSSYLKLAEEESAEINQLVVGNFIHAVLESFFNVMIEENKNIANLSEEEKANLTEKSCRTYIDRELGGGYNSTRTEILIDRIARVAKPIVDGLCDEFANCQFTPVACELHIDSHTKDTPHSIVYELENKEQRVIIDGYIDRTDTFKLGNDVYVRVVDYKTGIKNFSLDDIEEGENLQMLLYLKAITETNTKEFRDRLGVPDGGKIIPAGIVYVKTSVADITVDHPSDELALNEVKSGFERLGASLDDPDSLAAMNPEYTPMTKAKKNSPASAITYSHETWEQLNQKMRDVILEITGEITGGHIEAKPNESKKGGFHPCTDCQYKYLCRNAKQ